MATTTYVNNPANLDALKRRQVAICKGVAEMNKAFEIAISIVQSMNGKTLNKRLATAIQTAIDKEMGELKVSVRIETEFSGKATIVFGLYNRSYNNKPDNNGYCTCSYFDSEIYGHIYTNCLGTIDADEICKALQGGINYNKRTAYKYTDAVKNFTKDLKKYEKALDTFRKAYASINPLLCPSSLSSYELTKGYSYPGESIWEEKRDNDLGLI